MFLWMAIPLLFFSSARGRRIHLSAISTLIGYRRHPGAFAFSPTFKTPLPHLISPSTRLFAKQSKSNMRGVKKENLPSKICVVCNRPFTWRKKWERCWDEVTTCSKSCNSKRKGRRVESSSDLAKTDQKATSESKNMNTSGTNDGEKRVSMLAANIDSLHINDDTATAGKHDENKLERLLENTAEELGLKPVIMDDDQSECSQQLLESDPTDEFGVYPCLDSKARRKAEKKQMKARRRAQREGRGDPSAGQKQCTICSKSVNLLIRCTYDETEQWGMVCGKCWNDVSGGVVDGDAAHPHYRYGGLWKNRRAQKSNA